MKRIKSTIAADPDGPVLRGDNRDDLLRAQAFASRKRRHSTVAKHVEALRCRHPQIAFAILVKGEHAVAGQTVCGSKGVYLLAVNAVDPLLRCADPQSVVTVQEQRVNRQCAAIQSGL